MPKSIFIIVNPISGDIDKDPIVELDISLKARSICLAVPEEYIKTQTA